MKTDKEYPATHSMDTAWFVSDLDGNVAIFQFEEDGPGPIPYTNLHTDELIPMLGEEKEGISVMPFTQKQVEELKSGLKPVKTAAEIRALSNMERIRLKRTTYTRRSILIVKNKGRYTFFW